MKIICYVFIIKYKDGKGLQWQCNNKHIRSMTDTMSTWLLMEYKYTFCFLAWYEALTQSVPVYNFLVTITVINLFVI